MYEVDVLLIEVWMELDLHLDGIACLRLSNDLEGSFVGTSDLAWPGVSDALDVLFYILFTIIDR